MMLREKFDRRIRVIFSSLYLYICIYIAL